MTFWMPDRAIGPWLAARTAVKLKVADDVWPHCSGRLCPTHAVGCWTVIYTFLSVLILLGLPFSCCSWMVTHKWIVLRPMLTRRLPRFLGIRRNCGYWHSILTCSVGHILGDIGCGGCSCAVNVVDGELLHINKVSRLHMTAYLCVASNGVPPSISKRVQLRVQCKCLWMDALISIRIKYWINHRPLNSSANADHPESTRGCLRRTERDPGMPNGSLSGVN